MSEQQPHDNGEFNDFDFKIPESLEGLEDVPHLVLDAEKYDAGPELEQIAAVRELFDELLKDLSLGVESGIVRDAFELSAWRFEEGPGTSTDVLRHSSIHPDLGRITDIYVLRKKDGKEDIEKVTYFEDPHIDELTRHAADLYDEEEKQTIEQKVVQRIDEQLEVYLDGSESYKHPASYHDAEKLVELLKMILDQKPTDEEDEG